MAFGWAGWPIASKLFPDWDDQGYFAAKIVGVALVSYLIWVLGIIKLAPFTWLTVFGLVLGMIILGNFGKNKHGLKKEVIGLLVVQEFIFLGCLFFWSWIKAHEPSINGLEKFMDYGFTRSILQIKYFPPVDMWFSGEPINYYYFGHLILAVLTRFSGLKLAVTFNIMLATIFAWCTSMSFAIGRRLLINFRGLVKWIGALFIAVLVSLSGNLQTIYTFTKGYNGEETPPPFWKILAPWSIGSKTYWYPNATRFIPYTIHEFPSYSFVVSDVHGHVLDIPLALLAIALLITLFGKKQSLSVWHAVTFGVLSGMMFMTNALDGPVYLGLFGLLAFINRRSVLSILAQAAGLIVAFGITILPFVSTFKSFVSGVGVNCPPSFLANSKLGPFLFEGVEKCQKSPLWMMAVLWGFFVFGAIIVQALPKNETELRSRQLMLIVSLYCLGLIVFPEFFYFKDIYPMHFRSNTMFKFGYQVFIMMSLISGYALVSWVREKVSIKKLLILSLSFPMVVLVLVYPFFSVRSYFGNLTKYEGLYGLEWIKLRRPDDARAIDWFERNVNWGEQPVVLEANGDSYTEYERISAFTGLPTVAGWTVHEWLWRGGYGPISQRAEEVRTIYESGDVGVVKSLLKKYGVVYIIIGDLERQKYTRITESVLQSLGNTEAVFGNTTILKVM